MYKRGAGTRAGTVCEGRDMGRFDLVHVVEWATRRGILLSQQLPFYHHAAFSNPIPCFGASTLREVSGYATITLLHTVLTDPLTDL